MNLNPEVVYLSVESAKKWTLIIDSVQFIDFFFFMVTFSLFKPLGGLLKAFMGPCCGLLCPTGPHMELSPQVCHLCDQWAKKCSFIMNVVFLAFCVLKFFFDIFFCAMVVPTVLVAEWFGR